jgi:Ice-binding-like
MRKWLILLMFGVAACSHTQEGTGTAGSTQTPTVAIDPARPTSAAPVPNVPGPIPGTTQPAYEVTLLPYRQGCLSKGVVYTWTVTVHSAAALMVLAPVVYTSATPGCAATNDLPTPATTNGPLLYAIGAAGVTTVSFDATKLACGTRVQVDSDPRGLLFGQVIDGGECPPPPPTVAGPGPGPTPPPGSGGGTPPPGGGSGGGGGSNTVCVGICPTLGTTLSPYAILAGSTVTCSGASTVAGDIGVSPGTAITGFPAPCSDVGQRLAPPASDPGQLALGAEYLALAAPLCTSTIGPDLTGLTLVPGVYCVTAAASNLTGTVTLDAGGNSAANWIFQMTTSLITSSGATVFLTNGASACHVNWLVQSSATIGSGTTFVGNIVALTTIDLNSGASLSGRALARNGAVNLHSNSISIVNACQ